MSIDDLERITVLRRSLMQLKPIEAMEGLVKQLANEKSNEEFLMMVSKLSEVTALVISAFVFTIHYTLLTIHCFAYRSLIFKSHNAADNK